MDDELHGLLEDLATEQAPHGDREDVARRVTRRRRRRLASAGIVSVLVAALGIGLTLSALSFDRTTPADSPTATVSSTPDRQQRDVPKLDLLWSSEISDTAMSGDVLVDGSVIYVPTATGVVAYPVDCSALCVPLWRAAVGEGIQGPSVAAADGAVALVDPRRGLFVFDADCATDGSECQPRWSAQPGPGEYLSSPSIDHGIVRVTGGTGDAPGQRVRVLAFPVDCSGTCAPAWTADQGTGTIYGEVTVLDGVGYQQVGMTMYGFRSDCREDGGDCSPDLQIEATGEPTNGSSVLTGPVGDASDVVFSAGDGNLYSYAPHCGTSCLPLWVGAASDYLDTPPVIQGDVVYVATGGTTSGIVGFPLRCAGQCQPVMRADTDYASIEVADGQGLIAVSHFGRHAGVYVVPSGCGDPCDPAFQASAGGDVYGVIADASSVVVASSGDSIALYPRQCSEDCAPVQRLPVGGEAWWLFEGGGHLIVGAREGGAMATSVVVSVFKIG